MVASVDFYKIFHVIKLLHCDLSILIFMCSFYSHLHLLAPPPNWSKVASKFLQFTNYHNHVEVTRKGVNRGIGIGLKIPAKYFYADARVVAYVKNSFMLK